MVIASTLDIKVVSRVETVGGGSTETAVTYQEGSNTRAFGTLLHFTLLTTLVLTAQEV